VRPSPPIDRRPQVFAVDPAGHIPHEFSRYVRLSRMETPAGSTCAGHAAPSLEIRPSSRGLLAIALGRRRPWRGRGKTLLVAAIFFGGLPAGHGIAQVIFAFSLHVSAGGRGTAFHQRRGIADPCGAVFSAAWRTLFCCWRSGSVSASIFRGVATAVSAISDSALPGPRLGDLHRGAEPARRRCVMLASPFESIATLTLVVGAWLIVIGVFEVISSFAIRSASKSLTR